MVIHELLCNLARAKERTHAEIKLNQDAYNMANLKITLAQKQEGELTQLRSELDSTKSKLAEKVEMQSAVGMEETITKQGNEIEALK